MNAAVGSDGSRSAAQALQLQWSFGFDSHRTSNTVHTLNTPTRQAIFYSCSHTGVIHNTEACSQHLLQGHCNPITAVGVSRDKRLIVTADCGADAMLVVWDALLAQAARVFSLSAEDGGIVALDISPDGRYIYTVNQAFPTQKVQVWDWKNSAEPVASASLPAGVEFQHCIRVSTFSLTDIITNGQNQVVFWRVQSELSEQPLGELSPVRDASPDSPPVGISPFVPDMPEKKTYGVLTQSTFLPPVSRSKKFGRGLTATSTGKMIVWEPIDMATTVSSQLLLLSHSEKPPELQSASGMSNTSIADAVRDLRRDYPHARFPAKVLRLIAGGQSIDILYTTLEHVACAGQDGAVRFFDFQFRIAAYYEDIRAGEITSLSFVWRSEHPSPVKVTDFGAKLDMADQALSATVQERDSAVNKFNEPDFIIATAEGRIIKLDKDGFQNTVSGNKQGVPVLQGFDGSVDALDTHPINPYFAVGSSCGTLQIWDGRDRALIASRTFQPVHKTGSSAAAGTNPDGTEADHPETQDSTGPVGVSCIKFSPLGDTIAVGFSSGALKIISLQGIDAASSFALAMDAATTPSAQKLSAPTTSVMPEEAHFRPTTGAVTRVAWDSRGKFVAIADSLHCVCLFRFERQSDSSAAGQARASNIARDQWICIGKYRSHHEPIANLWFEASSATIASASAAVAARLSDASLPFDEKAIQDQLLPRLFSFGQDGVLQEYSLAQSSVRSGLVLLSSSRKAHGSRPTASLTLPAAYTAAELYSQLPGVGASPQSSHLVPDSVGAHNCLLVASDDMKLQVWGSALLSPPSQAAQLATQLPSVDDARHPLKSSYARQLAQCTAASQPLGHGLKKPSDVAEPPSLPYPVCEKTVLAPSFAGPVTRMALLPGTPLLSTDQAPVVAGSEKPPKLTPTVAPYVVYGTASKVVGLMRLPLDGNPTRVVGVIVHAAEISGMAISADGEFLLTAGGQDRSVNLWSIHPQAVDEGIQERTRVDGTPVDGPLDDASTAPWTTGLIEGGKQGSFYKELREYFVYSQLRLQGLTTTSQRSISGFISLDEMVNVARALSFYPSDQQISNMKDEIRLAHARQAAYSGSSILLPASQQQRSVGTGDNITIEEFVQMFVNQRPVAGLAKSDFEAAFAVLKKHKVFADDIPVQEHSFETDSNSDAARERPEESPLAISGAALLKYLQNFGEKMSTEDLTTVLKLLMVEPSEQQSAAASLLPSAVSPHSFAQDILGFLDY